MTLKIRPNKEAAAIIRGKAAADPETFGALLPELRARAFTIARVHDFDVLRDVMERIARVTEGGDWNQARREIAAQISPYMEESPDGRSASRNKAELLLRTHGNQAYAAAKYREQQAAAPALPWWKYVTVGDGKVREAHRALDGKIFRADDPFWETHYPPWDYGCRCTVVAVGDKEVARIEADEARKPEAERSVPRGEVLERARKGFLNVGARGVTDVRPPAERAPAAERDKAYRWNPGDLRPDAAALRQRYPEDVYRAFERAMARQTVRMADGSDMAVMDWIGGAS